MSRERMIECIAALEGDRERVLLLTEDMKDIQIEMMYKRMMKEQEKLEMEAAFN